MAGGLTGERNHKDNRRMASTLSNRLADISLPDADGKQRRLGSLWAERPAVIVFLRHYG
jgi:hypothetical protein